MRAVCVGLMMFLLPACFAQTKTYLLVGTYTSGTSKGINVYSFDERTLRADFVGAAETPNPSYLAISPDKKTVFAVNENADSTPQGVGGWVSSFSFDNASGQLAPVNKQFSFGKHPCYVSVDKSGKWLFVANYSSGSASIYPVKPGGVIDSATQVIQDQGTGPDKGRQEGPHAHSTVLSPDNNYLFVQDLGIDKIESFKLDKTTGRATAAEPAFSASMPGSGPRHLEFHPNGRYAYLVEEMGGTVVAFKYNDGRLDSIQRISSLPAGFTGEIGSADIHVSPDGNFLYASNRGDANSIAIFRIDASTGRLTSAGFQSTLGKTPRNFSLDPSGKFLLAANQDSGNVVIFKVDKKTGLLTDTGKRINVSMPVCLKWITE